MLLREEVKYVRIIHIPSRTPEVCKILMTPSEPFRVKEKNIKMEVRPTNNFSCNICVEDFFPSDNFSEDRIYFEVK